VARSVGHAPSQNEYARVAESLGLASSQTVHMRFGGWRRAMSAAGVDGGPPRRRSYPSQWDVRACWSALERVADLLGDPPSYRRYEELATERSDLPSGTMLRSRLGSWTEIAAELPDRERRRGPEASASRESPTGASPPQQLGSDAHAAPTQPADDTMKRLLRLGRLGFRHTPNT
jgi:hypothetical protein